MLQLISRNFEIINSKIGTINAFVSFRQYSRAQRFSSFFIGGSYESDKIESRNQKRYHATLSESSAIGRITGARVVAILYESRRFKGHSHWQNIAKTKTANDQAKAMITARLMDKIKRCLWRTKEINPKFNKELANILDECAANNIPKDTIKRALDRAVNSPPSQTHIFGIFGRSGIRLVVEVDTAAKNRTKFQINKICAKLGDFGILDQVEGFEERGVVKIFKDSSAAKIATSESESESAKIGAAAMLTLNDAETLAIELECEEVQEVEASSDQETAALFEFTCAPEQVDRVASALRTRGYVIQSTDSEFFPSSAPVKVTPQLEQSVKSFYQKMEEVEGLGRIFDNVHWVDEEE